MINQLRYGLKGPGFDYRLEATDFLFSEMSRPTLGPTQHPIQWVPRLFPGSNRLESEVNHLPSSSADVKNEWSHTYSPSIRLHGVDREKLS